MATVKIKLRPSSVEGKAGVIFYQITHNRKTQHITTRLRVQPFDWNADKEKLEPSAPNRSMIQNCIDCDVALLRSLISNLDTCRMNYSVNDIISRYKYNRGIQMYRFPNSDVQKSVIFEGIKKRLKIV